MIGTGLPVQRGGRDRPYFAGLSNGTEISIRRIENIAALHGENGQVNARNLNRIRREF